MESFASNILPAIAIVFDPGSLMVMVFGVIAGVCLGILPGFGGAQALALMFPFTFIMNPEASILFMVSAYSGAEYGGSIPAILIRTPGTTAAAMTVLDGFPMAQSGRAHRALTISILSGVFGGILSSIIFIFAATALAWVGLQFGPSEMFAVGLLGLAIIGSFVGKDPTKGFIGAGLGLLLSTVGSSGFGGYRFDFGQPYLVDGIPLIVMIISMLAAPEAFRLMINPIGPQNADGFSVQVNPTESQARLGLADLKKLIPTLLRGTLIGTGIGALPGPGPTIGALIAYNEEKRWSKTPEKFGSGIDEGIAAPESANNAVVAGALVPALALGVPGSGAIAVLIGVLISKGIVPGPTLFSEGGPLVLAIFVGLIACNIILLAVGVVGMQFFVPITKVSSRVLGPFVMLMIIIGAYAFDNNIAHSVMVLVLGGVAYLLDKFRFSTIPIILGFVMGPIIEQNLNRVLIINLGDFFAVLKSPLAASILILAVISAIVGYRRGRNY